MENIDGEKVINNNDTIEEKTLPNNDMLYLIMSENKNDILGYTKNINKAQEYCDLKTLQTGEEYKYNIIRDIKNVYITKPKNIILKANYIVSKTKIDIDEIEIIGDEKNNTVYENYWPSNEDKKLRYYFYFNMEIPSEMKIKKSKILKLAKIKADKLLEERYNNNNDFMVLINKQVLLKEKIIDNDI